MQKLSIIFLLTLLVILQYKLWFKIDGISGVIQIKNEIKKQEDNLLILKLNNIELLENIKDLKQNQNIIEEHVRVTFGMIKKDETYYRIIE